MVTSCVHVRLHTVYFHFRLSQYAAESKIYNLPTAFFHVICGFGKPSALHSTLAFEPWANALSVGSKIHLGGTIFSWDWFRYEKKQEELIRFFCASIILHIFLLACDYINFAPIMLQHVTFSTDRDLIARALWYQRFCWFFIHVFYVFLWNNAQQRTYWILNGVPNACQLN